MNRLFFSVAGLIFLIIISCEEEQFSSDNEIIKFQIDQIETAINHEENEIVLNVDKDSDISNLVVDVITSRGSTIHPDCSEPIDFNETSRFEVTAENGDVRVYSVEIEYFKSSDNKIISFKVNGLESEISNNILTIYAYKASDLTSVIPEVILPEEASISPDCTEPIDLSEPATFVVTAEDGRERKYTTRINRIRGLQSLEINIGDNVFTGSFNSTNDTATIDLSYDKIEKLSDTVPITLIPELRENFTLDPSTVLTLDSLNQQSTISLLDPNGVSEFYRIRIHNTDNEIYSFTYHDQEWYYRWDMNYFTHPDHTIDLPSEDHFLIFVWENRDISNIIPDISISKYATINPGIDVENDFTTDRYYTVTSQSGIKRTYTIRFISIDFIYTNWHIENYTRGIRDDDQFYLDYRCYSKIQSATLVNIDDGTEILLNIYSHDYISENEEASIHFTTQTALIPNQRYIFKTILETGKTIETNLKVMYWVEQ